MRLISAHPEKRVLASALACGMLLVLPGCLPNLRRAEPGPVLPADFNGRSSAESSAQVPVDEFFDDPVLTGMIAQALASNQELRILNQEVQVAANEVMARRGAYLPFLALRGDAGLDKHSLFTPLGAAEDQLLTPKGGRFPDPLPNFAGTATFFWQIDIWRELRNARDAAAKRYVAAIERRNYFVTQIVAEVADNYFELLALDQRLLILDQIIALQERSLETARLFFEAGRGTELGVQRFQAEVRKNQSEKLIVRQEIIQVQNEINFLLGRYPQTVERPSVNFIDLQLHALSVGLPAQLLLNRRDIRQAEREIEAAGLDVMVARARFFPRLDITANVGYEAFNPRYLFNPEALAGNVAAGLIVPVLNRKAIQADYCTANARQLQAIYNYQRVVLNAFTEVVNTLNKVENYGRSIEIKKTQLDALEKAVNLALSLFQANRGEYVDVLFSQRDLLEARTVLVQTKQQQLSAIVFAYQALGGGCWLQNSTQNPPLPEDGEVVPAPLPPEIKPGDAPVPAPAPIPGPAPAQVPAAPAPDAAPLPADNAGLESDPFRGEQVGRATVEESSRSEMVRPAAAETAETDRTVVRPAGGHPGAGEPLASPVTRRPTPRPDADAGGFFDAMTGAGFQTEEATSSEPESGGWRLGEVGQNRRLPSAPAGTGSR